MRNFTPFKQLLCAMLILPLATSAQLQGNGLLNVSNYEPHGGSYPRMHAAKTTTDNACRLIAMSAAKWDGVAFVPMDSSTFAYPGGRGSDVRMNSVFTKNDSGKIFYYDGSSAYQERYKNEQTFDANGNFTLNIIRRYPPYLSTWRNFLKQSATYDANNNMLTYTAENWDTVANVWTNAWHYNYTYNTSNKQTSYVIEKWIASTSSWRNYSKGTYTYDGAGNCTQTLGESWDTTASNWVNATRYSLTFDGSGNMTYQLTEQWNTALAVWQNTYLTTYSNFVDHKPEIIVWKTWNAITLAFENSQKELYSYNSFGQTVAWEDQYWNALTVDWYRTLGSWSKHYYYETYITAVTNISRGKAEIYPVPAQDEVHINAIWDESQDFSVAIIDMQGRVLKTWDVDACIEYSAVVPVKNLPAGNYIVKLSGAKGSLTRSISIVK